MAVGPGRLPTPILTSPCTLWTLSIARMAGPSGRTEQFSRRLTEAIRGAQSARAYCTDLYSVRFIDEQSGWAVGDCGSMVRTVDGGEHWWCVALGISVPLNVIRFMDPDTGWIAGDRGVLYKTTDAGQSWRQVPMGTLNRLIDLHADATGRMWVVGEGGTILSNGTSFISSNDLVSRDIFSFARLDQNYPNPFNPNTTIKYELPKSSVVNLNVYDMLGREVAVLVNEKQEAGSHETKFDASGLSSGVYFYRMQAGEYVSTKKMLVLR